MLIDRRALPPLLLATALILAAGCGSEPPAPGDLVVTSSPAGAAITLDGAATGEVTPHEFPDLAGGSYVVTVSLDGWTTFPGERTVEVPYGARARADFTLSQLVGALTVTSTPPGATIEVDGEDTGEVTPHTFAAWPAGQHEVTVVLENYLPDPAVQMLEVPVGGEASAAFDLLQVNVPRVALLEGFSNTYCPGCPTFNAHVGFVMGQPGYGRDRLIYVKWPAYLSPLDPFWRATESITDARVTYYYGSRATTLPSAHGDGALLGSLIAPPNAEGIMQFVDQVPAFAPVRVDVTTAEDLGDVDDLDHDLTVTLHSVAGVDLTGHVLHVVLLYDHVTTTFNYPSGNGTEFHWVLRDHVVAAADIGPLAPRTPREFAVTVHDPYDFPLPPAHAIHPEGKQLVAFIQHGTTKEVVQCGSTMTADAGAAPRAAAVATPVPATPGGPR